MSRARPRMSDSPFTFSMEGYNGFDRPREEVAFAWAPGWNSPQAWNKFTDEVGGHLSAGDPGVRLLHPQPGDYDYHAAIPANFTPRDSAWQVVVLPRLFGGEETSSRAAPIIERAAPATLRLSADDAQRLGCSDGDLLSVATKGGQISLPVQLDGALPAGLIGVPAGVEPGLASGDWAELSPGAPNYPMPLPRHAVAMRQEIAHELVVADGRRQSDRHAPGRGDPARRGVAGGGDDGGRAAPAGVVAGPLRTQPGRAFRLAAAGRRHDQDLLQGGLDPAVRRSYAVRAGAGDRHGLVAAVVLDHSHHAGLGRGGSQYRAAVFLRHGRHQRLCGAVRRLVERQQVCPDRRHARLGADALLRGVHGPGADGRGGDDRLVQHARDRQRPGRTCGS